MLADLIEAHDRARFEIFGFAIRPGPEDEMRQRLAAGFDQLLDVGQLTEPDITARARS